MVVLCLQSLPGVLAVKRVGGVPTVFPADAVAPADNLLRPVYDMRPLEVQLVCMCCRDLETVEWPLSGAG